MPLGLTIAGHLPNWRLKTLLGRLPADFPASVGTMKG